MKTEPNVLWLPSRNEILGPEWRSLSKETPYGYAVKGNNLRLVHKDAMLPNLKERNAYHIYLQKDNRIYHASKIEKEDDKVLVIELGNSFIPKVLVSIDQGILAARPDKYTYRTLRDFGMVLVRPDTLIPYDQAVSPSTGN